MSTLEALNEDFRDMLEALAAANTDFLVIGAYALAYHGIPRATGDIDLFVRPSTENAQRVWQALLDFGAPVASAEVTPADFARAGTVYQIGLPPRRIDLLTEISGVSFDDAWMSRVAATLGARTIYFIGLDALIKNKAAAGRPKDLADLGRLRKR